MIAYRHQRGETAFRVMSHVIRQAEKIGARCQVRHGERHTVLHSGPIEVIDSASGKLIEIADVLTRRA